MTQKSKSVHSIVIVWSLRFSLEMHGSVTALHIRNGSDEITTFSILLFISSNLFFASLYSIYREAYAIDQEYLKRVRTILVMTTLLQIACFGGYWLGIYLMYELCWIIWLTLSTFSIFLMGIRFAQTYIILCSPHYQLKDHADIPKKYVRLVIIFWFIGSCIDITGTVVGLFNYTYIQSLCYALWEILCSISVGFLIYILKRVRNKFSDIIIKKATYQTDAKTQRKRIKQYKIEKTNKRKKVHSQQTTIHEHYDQIDEEIAEHTVVESSKASIMLTHTISAGSNTLNNYNYGVLTNTASSAGGSINDSLLSKRTSSGNIMRSEVRRMSALIIGLYGCIVVFVLNAFFNGFFRFSGEIFSFYDKTFDGENDLEKEQLYRMTPLWVIAYVFFPQWTMVNMFVLMFSWIPNSQMTDEWGDD